MTKVIIEGFNVMDIVRNIDQQAKKSQAGLLGTIEQLITDDDLYSVVRKAVLDYTNEFARSVVKSILGDVDY